MANVPNDVSKLDGLFKIAYSDRVLNLLPEFSILGKLVPFSAGAAQLGKQFQQPVVLSDEQGVTYVASGGGSVTLEDAVAGQVSHAIVNGSNFYIRSQIDYEAIMKSMTSKNAFLGATQHVVKRMVASAAKRLEISRLYGQSGIATVATLGTAGATRTVTISDATWAGGIWNGMKGARLDAYSAVNVLINTNAALVVDSVNPATKTVTLSGNTTDLAALVATNVLFFRTSFGNEMLGLDKIATTSGTLFGIDNTVYDAFKGNSYPVGGALSMQKVLGAADLGVVRGLMGDATLLVNPSVWTQLNVDQAALRRYDETYDGKELETGVEAIVYHYSGGKISIIAHPMVKIGDGFLFKEDDLKRIGATELTFNDPVDGKVVFHDPNKTAKEIRAMANEALFCEQPAHLIKLSGITVS